MTKTKRKRGLPFSKLSDEAKEKAREWWRESGDGCDGLEDLLNRDLEDHYGLAGCKVHYSLGYCQGDGCCFQGKPDMDCWRKADAELNHQWTELDALAGLMNFSQPEFWVNIKHSGHYYHEHSMDLEMEWQNPPAEVFEPAMHAERPAWAQDVIERVEVLEVYLKERIVEIARELRDTGYAEIEHQNSDEYIDEYFEANDHYRFDREGNHL